MKRICILAAWLIALVLSVTAADSFINPVANGADPFVLKDGDTYYLYVTADGNYGYRVYTSENLVEWEVRGYCLRKEDVYTDQAARPGVYNFWAPEVIRDGDTYYMVYAAQEHIGIAASDSPLGPFTNDADSFLLENRAIDGHFFRDANGEVYLYFVSVGKWTYEGVSMSGNNIWGAPFDLATRSFKEEPRLLLSYDTGEGHHIAEGPEMLQHGGKYYLTYSSNDYRDPAYCVKYAVSDSPMGPFEKYAGNPILQSDDALRTDTQNPHLYGTAHHCFTTSPDGKELVIVYHAHRTGIPYVTTNKDGTKNEDYVGERRVCLDKAWFDSKGILHAGTKKDGVPTAVSQPLPSGGKLTREQELIGTPFVTLETLPTVYVSYKDGDDRNDGLTDRTALKTLQAAYAAIPNGGTIVLTQYYSMPTVFVAPAVKGPVMLKGQFGAVPLLFKFIVFQSDTYLDDLVLTPVTSETNISLIECGFHNVTIGEGVSCRAQATRTEFPYLVGGAWWSQKESTHKDYIEHFQGYTEDAQLYGNAEYTLRVLSGTWNLIAPGSMREFTPLTDSAPNGIYIFGGDAAVAPAAATAPSATFASDGAHLTWAPVERAERYVIYRDGKLFAFADTAEYTDATYKRGTEASYAVAGYLHGACIGVRSAETTLVTTLGLEVKLTIGKTVGYVNGAEKVLDAAPVIRNDRTMLPVRFVAENLGATVGWDGATSTVTVTADGVKVEIIVGSRVARVNGNAVILDSPAFIESSRTYLPVRFIAESIGAKVAWDGTTSTATLTK